MDFIFVDEGTKFPKISHAISFKNQSWRIVHFKRILEELGIAEDKAKQAIEQAEGKKGETNIVAAYHAIFDKATARHPEVKIEVFEDDKLNPKTGRPYVRADFKNPRVGFSRKPQASAAMSSGTILNDGEELDLGDALPF